jgi:peptide/nickel transport system permease protein
VSSVIAQDLPWTLVLLTISVLISFTLGTLVGVYMAWRRGSPLDALLSSVMMFCYSIFFPWLGLLAVFYLAFRTGWFPFTDAYNTTTDSPALNLTFLSDAAYHAILPAATLVVSTIAGWMLTMRNSMITTLSEDYVLMARAKGLSSRRVMFAYAARNAILPSVTGLAIAVGAVVGGQFLVEVVFSYPGIGYALVQGIGNHDYSLTDGILLMVTLAIVAANFRVDLL